MKYFKIGLVLVVGPVLATLLAEWLKTVDGAQRAMPLLDFLTGAIPVPRVALFVMVLGLVCVVLIEALGSALEDDPAPRPRTEPVRRTAREARRDYLRKGPATLFGSGPDRVPLSRAEELIMIELAHADPQPLETAALLEKLGEPPIAIEHAADLLIARQMATHEVVGNERFLHFTPQGRAVSVQRGYNEARQGSNTRTP